MQKNNTSASTSYPSSHKTLPKRNVLRESLIDFSCRNSSNFNYAVTLTFQRPESSRLHAEKIGLRFQQNYNNALGLRNWQRKYKKDETQRAAIFAVLEGDGRIKHFHYHLMLSKPENISHEDFVRLTKNAWIKTGNGSITQNRFETIYDANGWVDYITKQICSTSMDAVHWEATHIFTEKLNN